MEVKGGQTEGSIDGQTGGWTERRTNRQIYREIDD
jgi:hypothetical protein